MELKPHDSARSVRRWPLLLRLTLFVWFFTVLGTSKTQAQLAITEVMSQAATNLGDLFVSSKSDYWELTNFGTNTLALDGYSFSDRDTDPAARVFEPFQNCLIGPGESIVFLRTDAITNRQDFYSWWGASALGPDLQVRSYPRRPGFDQEVDAVQLFDGNGNLVDRVDFGQSLRGHTFVYDPGTGEFGTFSTWGVNGAFKAISADDVGSPGVTTGPIALSFLQQPAAASLDAGSDAEFSVRAAGLPRPMYQWYFNGVAIPGARKSNLIVTNIQPQHAGDYTVRINNGLELVMSDTATLEVNTNPAPAVILVPPTDAFVFEGQTAVFSVKAGGYPPTVYQWQANGVNIPGATNRTLSVPAATLTMSGRIYTVHVQNPHGSASASARLEVTTRPRLVITEVMAAVLGGTDSGRGDWFELTNFDTNAVNLFGYRFSDRYSFDVSYTITEPLIIQPGESVVFVERLSAEQFAQWWGHDALPPGLQISTYTGLGFSSLGDVINIWNSAETDPYDPVASAGFLESTRGFSLRFIPPDYYFVEDSVAGVDGAFRAAAGADIGSPGYLANPPARFVCITRTESEFVLRCRVIEGKAYALRSKTNLTDPTWIQIGTFTSEETVMTITLPQGETGQQFFLLEEVP